MCCNEKDKGKLVSNGELVHRALLVFPLNAANAAEAKFQSFEKMQNRGGQLYGLSGLAGLGADLIGISDIRRNCSF